MANVQKELHSIRNMQLVSSICVHSTHSCEANKSQNSKPVLSKKKLNKIDLRVRFIPLKIAAGFWVLKIVIF